MDAIVCATGLFILPPWGAGAILSKCILSSEIAAYEDLGHRGSPQTGHSGFSGGCGDGCPGNNLYETAVKEFCTL